MYIKKILLAIALMGLVGAGIFAYHIYSTLFSPNTAFNNDVAHVFIKTGARYGDVREELKPLVKDLESFDAVANRKEYMNNITPGHFIIKNGSNNNEIINAIRSGNIPIKISFNNQERVENLAGRIAEQLEVDSLA
ncbi:MAG TPA: aminodeoxychorismate lyase, partial [Leeuwenhoekiella sp.]|nr:aminodeoxychorismate lyase [Leeuwenhoekiella sp.]